MSRSSLQVNSRSSPADKIRLFRELFRGRDDRFARQYIVRSTGKSGFAPACGNEWVPNVCDKPRIKCLDCAHQHFLSITDEVVRWHLLGCDPRGCPCVIGIYPLLRDETCWLSVIQLESPDWRDDADAIRKSCRRFELTVSVESSSGGQSGNLWLFFAQPIAAALARKLAAMLLTDAMDRRPALGFSSYDRIIPNQDTLPQRGLGDVIALPFQRQLRDQGYSEFLDGRFAPFADQWSWLASVPRISREAAEFIVARAARRGRVLGVRLVSESGCLQATGQQPSTKTRARSPSNRSRSKCVQLELREQITISKVGVAPRLQNRLLRVAAFQNAEFLAAQAMRLSACGIPQIVACARDFPDRIALPRGCLEAVQRLLINSDYQIDIVDRREPGTPQKLQFCGALNQDQRVAAEAMADSDSGVLIAPPGFGKTVVAAWLIAHRAVNTLVIVHRRQLADQWISSLRRFLNLTDDSIARLGRECRDAPRREPRPSANLSPAPFHDAELRATLHVQPPVHVALFQSLMRRRDLPAALASFGHVVIDECHHVAAPRFVEVLQHIAAKFVTGLSAVLERKDGRHPLVCMQCGPVRYRCDEASCSRPSCVTRSVIVRPTDFRFASNSSRNPRVHFADICSQLVADSNRNQLICDDVRRSLAQGHSPLVLTERHQHLEILAGSLAQCNGELIVLRGGMRKDDLQEASRRLQASVGGIPRILLATGQFLGEGFDDSQLDTLFLTHPISWRGTIAQYVGRLQRTHPGKKQVHVYDYADLNEPMLARMFERRCRAFESSGYAIYLPGAAPGWPSNIELPADLDWKRSFLASVQRLAKDGVDPPLAKLFRDATQTVEDLNGDIHRARSASEAFLFRRLDSLPATAGRFQLNASLPIPFDGNCQMEVDLLCPDARLAIELDGAQHLNSRAAYRTDRRKDALLQRHGYLVLRFLTEDVAAQLGDILDSILAALVQRTSVVSD